LVEYRSVVRDPENWIGDPPPEWGPSATASSGLYLDFLDEPYRFDDATRQRLGHVALRQFRLGPAQVRTVRSLIADLTGDGRQVLVLATPVTADYVALHPNGAEDDRAFRDLLQRLAAETDVPFLDAGVWDRSLFADPLHVNRAGADRLTDMVRDAIDRQNWK
jgi:lysophospholipase L1-like esterase